MLWAEVTGYRRSGGKNQYALVCTKHSQWQRSGERWCLRGELGSVQAGLVGHVKATRVHPENIRESLKGSMIGEKHMK